MASLFCPFCGTENPDSRQFCRKCASDLRAPVRDPNAPVAPEPGRAPMRPILIGGGIVLVVVVLLVAALALLGGSPAASPSPSPLPTDVPASATAAPSPSVVPDATAIATPAAATPENTAPTDSQVPGASPIVDSLSGPRRASCTEANGTTIVGYINLEWTASNTTGVRLSIDPPAPNNAYDYGYDDYPAVASAEVPFTCEPPNTDATGAYHLYVVTTQHDGGYFAYRYVKVYLRG